MTNIVLTGFMGTGKSSVGRRLAAELGLIFLDMDAVIEGETGMSVTAIFESMGEARFRGLERALIERITNGEFGDGLVASSGGGAFVDPVNRRLLKGWALVVCLKASTDEILRRVGHLTDRPLLSGPNKRDAVHELMLKRSEAYEDSDLIIDTTGVSLDKIVEEIRDVFEKQK